MATVNLLVVAWWGAWGSWNWWGWGGWGWFSEKTWHTVTAWAYTVTVWNWGTVSAWNQWGDWGNSSFDSIISNGWGGWGNTTAWATSNGRAWGSAWGSWRDQIAAVWWTANQWNTNGATGYWFNWWNTTANNGWGGGWGASAAWSNGNEWGNSWGGGGAWRSSSISWAAVTYGWWGGGSIYSLTYSPAWGAWGGWNWTNRTTWTAASAGTNWLGGGGGGGGTSGAVWASQAKDGWSWVVVISYATDWSTWVSTSSTGGTITTSGGQTIHTFTTSGTWTMVAATSTKQPAFFLNFI